MKRTKSFLQGLFSESACFIFLLPFSPLALCHIYYYPEEKNRSGHLNDVSMTYGLLEFRKAQHFPKGNVTLFSLIISLFFLYLE